MTGVRSPIQPTRQEARPEAGMAFAEISLLLQKLQGMETDFKAAKAEVEKAVSHALTVKIGPRGLQGLQGPRGPQGESIQGPQGEKGEKGDRGDDGESPEIDIQSIAQEVLQRIKAPKDGKDAVIDIEEITESVHKAFTSKKKLKPTDLDGWEQTIAPIRSLAAGFRGGGDTVTAGTNVTITTNANGQKVISSSGGAGATFYTETPIGDINGINTVYTVANSITTIVAFSLNGQFIHPSEYSVAGTTITFVTAPDASLSGLPFTIVYA